MKKNDVETPEGQLDWFPKIKAYSVDDIMAAGGPDAFAEKNGKSWEKLIERLKELPKEAFLTDEEVEEAIKTLNESK